MKIRLFLAVLMMFLGFLHKSYAQEATIDVKSIGQTVLSEKRTAIKVILRQDRLDSKYPYKDALIWGGDDTKLPKTVLTSIDIRLGGGEKVFIPLSAYSDFGNVRRASLHKAANGFELSIHGGETAAAYDAVLVFKNDYLHRRKVTHREFPDEAWEETTYSFNTGEN